MAIVESAETATRLLNPADFQEFGADNGIPENMPTRIWYCLARLHNRALNSDLSWSPLVTVSHVCLVYRSPDTPADGTPARAPFSDLEAPSLVQFVTNTNQLLGRGYGPAVLEFLNRLVEIELAGIRPAENLPNS